MKISFGNYLQCFAAHQDRQRSLAVCLAMLMMAALVVLTCSDPAVAQPAPAGAIDEIDTAFQDAVNAIGDDLKDIARNLLYGLLLIELVWTFGQIVMTGGNIGRIISEFFQRVFIAGLFLLLIDGIPAAGGNIGITTFILRSAEALSDATIESSIKPAAVFGDIFKAGSQIYDATSGGLRRIAAALVWLMLMVVGAIVAGIMLVAYIEVYMAFTIGILTLGFGVWKQTSGIARNFLFSAAGRIFKLFAVLLIVAVIRLQLDNMKGISAFEDGVILIGMLIIFIMVLITVPAQVESMVSGAASISADGKIMQTVTYLPGRAVGKATDTALGATGRAAATGAKVTAGTTRVGVKAAGNQLAATIRAINARP